MKIFYLCILVTCLACGVIAQDDEPRAAPPRGLLKRGLLSKGKPTTTTTTTPSPQDEQQYDDAEYVDEEEGPAVSEATPEAPSSTEGKKLVGAGRPLRSDSKLLEALKRRRAQAAEAKLHSQGSTSTTSAAPEPAREAAPIKASSFNGKKRFTSPKSESNNEDATPIVKPNRNRFNRPSPKTIQQEPEQEEQPNETVQVRSGRTFPRRGGN